MLNQDVLKEFLFDCRMRKLSERTMKGYKNNSLRFFAFIEREYKITELEETYFTAIQGYIDYMMRNKLSETYINGIIKCLRAFFNYCKEENYILKNPMDKIKFQKEPIVMINTFSDNEVKRMVRFYNGKKFLDIRNHLIMVLLFDSVDFVITHTAPESIVHGLCPWYEKDELTQFLSMVDGKLEYKHWFFGHFHDDRVIDNKHTLLYEDVIRIRN